MILERFNDYVKELKKDHEDQLDRVRKDFQGKFKTLQERDAASSAELERDREDLEAMREALE
jgi:ribosome recycling factor